MSILTRVLVVLVMVCSVAFVAMLIPFVHNLENLNQQLADAKTELQAAQKLNEVRTRELTQLKNRNFTVVNDYKIQAERLKKSLELKDKEIQQLNKANSELALANDVLEVDNKRLEASVTQLTGIHQDKLQELERVRGERADYELQVIQLSRRVDELLSVREQLSNAVDRVRELLVASTARNKELTDRIAKLPPGQRAEILGADEELPPFVPTFTLDGEVTSVRRLGGKTFIEINVGKNDRVQERMKFVVFRNGDELVGEMVVSMVDEQNASGMMTLMRDSVSEGDRVRTGPMFAGSS